MKSVIENCMIDKLKLCIETWLFYLKNNNRSHSIKTDVKTESMFDVMLSGPQPVTTLLVIKPRAVKKHLTKILRKIMLEGFKVVGLRQAVVEKEEELLCLIDEEGELVNM